VTDSGLNFRLNPTAAGSVAVDADPDVPSATPPVVGAAGAQPDGTQTPADSFVGGTAYTNAFGQALSGGFTTQYGISAAQDQLQIQNPFNGGNQTLGKKITVGGATLGINAVKGFDIPAGVRVSASNAVADGSGTAIVTTDASPNGAIYAINLGTGAATLRGTFPASPAVVPVSLALGDGPAPAKVRTAPPTTPGTNPPVIVVPPGTVPGVKPPVIVPPAAAPATFGKSTKLTVKLRSTRSKRNGPAKVTFRTTNNFSVKVRLQATTPKSGKRKAIKYSTKTYTVKKSSSRTINLRLPSAARKVLQSKKKLTIKVTLRVTDPAKKNRTVRKTLTLRLSR
jgi:hypothetical protein